MATVSINTVTPRRIGAASGVFNTFHPVGAVLGSAAPGSAVLGSAVLGSAVAGVLVQARLAATMPAAVATAAAQMPAQHRGTFVAAMHTADASGAPTVFRGIPPAFTAQSGQWADAALHTGVTAAAGSALWLPVATLITGMVVCLFFATKQSTETDREAETAAT